MALLEKLHNIKHPDHPLEVIAAIMMTSATFALISTIPWAVPKRVGKFFEVPQEAITETDQQRSERKWIVKKLGETNYGNLDMCLVMMWERIIP